MSLVALDWNPKQRTLRQFAAITGVFCALCVGFFWQRHADPAVLWTIGTLGAVVGLLGTLWPETVRYVYIAVMVGTYPIGWLMNYVILGVIFFGVFTPVALWFRLIGRDVLQRRLDPAVATYWEARPPAPPARRYLRQY